MVRPAATPEAGRVPPLDNPIAPPRARGTLPGGPLVNGGAEGNSSPAEDGQRTRRMREYLPVGTGRAVTESQPARWPPRWARWLPPLFILVAVALEITVPPRYFFGSLLSASLLLAALVYPPLWTAATGAACVAVLFLLGLSTAKEYREQLAGALISVCVVTVLVTLLSVLRVRVARQLNQVRAVAQAAQLALLRPLPARVGPVRLAGCYQAATDEALIGGDLYGVRQTPYGLRVLVGDVRGKGIGATGTVATILASFREAAMVCPDLPAVADRIEAALALDREDTASGLASGMTNGMVTGMGPMGSTRYPPAVEHLPPDPDAAQSVAELFATAVLLEFPEGRDTVHVLDRGHPPLLRLSPQEVTPLETEYGLPLGFGELAPVPRRVQSYELPPGRMLVAYSDGVTEARDRDGEFYPLQQRLTAHFTGEATGWDTAAVTPGDVVTFIQHDVTRWAPTLNDDLVVVVLQRTDQPATPTDQG